MSTSVYPYINPAVLKLRQEESTARELAWLLNSLQETLASLKSGLEECYALLAPIEPGSTLVLSSPRSESVKGLVTRVGSRLVKGTLHLRLRTLPSALTINLAPDHPLTLSPLSSLQTLLNQSLDCVDITRWTGDHTSAVFISSQFRLLHSLLLEALGLLKGPTPPSTPTAFAQDSHTQTAENLTVAAANIVSRAAAKQKAQPKDTTWFTDPPSPSTFTPPLPSSLSICLLPTPQSTLLLIIRVLEPTSIQPNLGSRFALAIGASRRLEHDEMDEVFMYRGDEVRVREKVRVESPADPVLLVLCAKLGALERSVAEKRCALGVLMGLEDGDDEGWSLGG